VKINKRKSREMKQGERKHAKDMNISKKIFQNKVSREPHQLCMLNEFP
jgi:hypothetical protein